MCAIGLDALMGMIQTLPFECQRWISIQQAIFSVDAHHDDGTFIARANEKLTAFVELESA